MQLDWMTLNLSYHSAVPYFSKTLKKKINKTMENHKTKPLQFDGNFLKLEYTSEINISFYIKRNCPEETDGSKYKTFK